jgi:hypothetical protein
MRKLVALANSPAVATGSKLGADLQAEQIAPTVSLDHGPRTSEA